MQRDCFARKGSTFLRGTLIVSQPTLPAVSTAKQRGNLFSRTARDASNLLVVTVTVTVRRVTVTCRAKQGYFALFAFALLIALLIAFLLCLLLRCATFGREARKKRV